MLRKPLEPFDELNCAATGFKDGVRICTDVRDTEWRRRHIILKAAKELCGQPENAARYLDGLESGMQQGGTLKATARRLRYEAAVIISSYGVSVAVERPKKFRARGSEPAVRTEQLD